MRTVLTLVAMKALGVVGFLLGLLLFAGGLFLVEFGSTGRLRWDAIFAACMPAAGFFLLLRGVWLTMSWNPADLLQGTRILALAVILGLVFMLGMLAVALFEGLSRDILLFLTIFPGSLLVVAALDVGLIACERRRYST